MAVAANETDQDILRQCLCPQSKPPGKVAKDLHPSILNAPEVLRQHLTGLEFRVLCSTRGALQQRCFLAYEIAAPQDLARNSQCTLSRNLSSAARESHSIFGNLQDCFSCHSLPAGTALSAQRTPYRPCLTQSSILVSRRIPQLPWVSSGARSPQANEMFKARKDWGPRRQLYGTLGVDSNS